VLAISRPEREAVGHVKARSESSRKVTSERVCVVHRCIVAGLAQCIQGKFEGGSGVRCRWDRARRHCSNNSQTRGQCGVISKGGSAWPMGPNLTVRSSRDGCYRVWFLQCFVAGAKRRSENWVSTRRGAPLGGTDLYRTYESILSRSTGATTSGSSPVIYLLPPLRSPLPDGVRKPQT
jgi:hypothetical protein